MDVHFEVRPYTNNLDWVFTWETDHWTEPGEDIVTIDLVNGSDCAFTHASLQDGVTGGVTTRLYYQVDPDTQAVTYRHEVRWDNRPCVTGCSYSYDVESRPAAVSNRPSQRSGPPRTWVVSGGDCARATAASRISVGAAFMGEPPGSRAWRRGGAARVLMIPDIRSLGLVDDFGGIPASWGPTSGGVLTKAHDRGSPA